MADAYALIAQIIGFIAVGFSLFIYISLSRRTILVCKLTDDVLWAVHYMMIGGYTAGALNIMALFREIVFCNRGKKWASSRLWLYFFLGVTCVSSLISWEGPISLMPMVGSLCSVVSLWMKDPFKIRLLAVPAQVLWLIYNIIHGSPAAITGTVIAIVSITVGFVRDFRVAREKRENDA